MLLKERGVTARAMGWGHSLRLREERARRNAPSGGGQLFAVAVVMMTGEIERNEADLCSSILGLNADDVLVFGRPSAKLEMAAVIRVDVDGVGVVVFALAAGESGGGATRLAYSIFPLTLEDVAVASHVLAIEGLDFIGRVGGLEGGGFDAEMEVAEVEVDVGGVAFLAVMFLDRHGAGVGGEADAGDVGILVGLDVHGAEGRAHADVVSVAALAVGDAAAGEEETGGGDDGQTKRVRRG